MSDVTSSAPHISSPTFREALTVWGRIGLLSFGGPAAQIAVMHRILVDEKGWLEERRFLPALNFCMLLPGPEAMQLATYAGWRLHGVAGGLAAGLLFVVPGAIVMLVLTVLYMLYGALPLAVAVFTGIKAAVLAIVIQALMRVARRALCGGVDWAIATAAFVAIFFLGVPFPIIIALAALAGYLLRRDAVVAQSAHVPPRDVAASAIDAAGWRADDTHSTIRTALVWLTVWLAPIAALAIVLGTGHILVEIGLFFSKLAVVSFGGAYAVLSYMAQEVVQRYGWLNPGEMLDALGLAETTPGPLILVTEFVGGLAAGRASGELSVTGAIAGALVTLWATFAPCFLWIFAGAPFVERINAEPRLRSALRGVTAAVVGVIANLTVWFTLHVLFREVVTRDVGFLRLTLPDVTTLDPVATILSALAALMIFGAGAGVFTTLAISGGLAWLATLAM